MEAANSLTEGPELVSVSSILKISVDKHLLRQIKASYSSDSWCKKLPSATQSWPELCFENELWYVGDRLIVPHTGSLHKTLF